MGGAANAIFDVVAAPPARPEASAPADESGAFQELLDTPEAEEAPRDRPERPSPKTKAGQAQAENEEPQQPVEAVAAPPAPQPEQRAHAPFLVQAMTANPAQTPTEPAAANVQPAAPAPQQATAAAPQPTTQATPVNNAPTPAKPTTNAKANTVSDADAAKAPVQPTAQPQAPVQTQDTAQPAQTQQQPQPQTTAVAQQPAQTPAPTTPVIAPPQVITEPGTSPPPTTAPTEGHASQTIEASDTRVRAAAQTPVPQDEAASTKSAPPTLIHGQAQNTTRTPTRAPQEPIAAADKVAAPAPAPAAPSVAPPAPPATALSTANASSHVADAAAAAHPPATTQVSREIVRRFNGGATQFEMRLDPPELGRVEVKLEVSRDHRVTAVISADSPQALSELTRHARDLEQALQSAGLDLSDNGLSFDLSERRNNFAAQERDAHRGGPAQNGELAEETPAPRARPIGFESWRGARVDLVA